MSSTFEDGLPDMPQLYTKVVPKNKRRLMVVDGGSLALQHRQPQMALAMSIIAAGATIETQLSNLLIPMMGHKAEAAIDHYYSLKTEGQKFSVIKAIAISSLEDEDFALLEAIIKCAQTTQKLRNPIAHWMVAFTPDRPTSSRMSITAIGLRPHKWLRGQN
jgi:hypothetical protein